VKLITKDADMLDKIEKKFPPHKIDPLLKQEQESHFLTTGTVSIIVYLLSVWLWYGSFNAIVSVLTSMDVAMALLLVVHHMIYWPLVKNGTIIAYYRHDYKSVHTINIVLHYFVSGSMFRTLLLAAGFILQYFIDQSSPYDMSALMHRNMAILQNGTGLFIGVLVYGLWLFVNFYQEQYISIKEYKRLWGIVCSDKPYYNMATVADEIRGRKDNQLKLDRMAIKLDETHHSRYLSFREEVLHMSNKEPQTRRALETFIDEMESSQFKHAVKNQETPDSSAKFPEEKIVSTQDGRPLSSIDEETVSLVLSEVPIENIVKSRLKSLTFVSERYSYGFCPFHDHQGVMSLAVDKQQRVYQCAVCNAQGDAIQFVAKYDHVNYGKAAFHIAADFGLVNESFVRTHTVFKSKGKELEQKYAPTTIPQFADKIEAPRPALDKKHFVYNEKEELIGRVPVDNYLEKEVKIPPIPETEMRHVRMQEIEEQLSFFVGLTSLKKEMQDYAKVIQVMKERANRGLISPPLNLHAMFLGNPGTGKTSFARILGDVYVATGMLRVGHVVEVDRSKLVGAYVGHTAKLTYAKCVEALDGVLFVDEAYTLMGDTKDAFGTEALNTIMKFMEDHRDRIAVVFAGYPEETKKLYQVNPGMQSRISKEFYFTDYSNEELLTILHRLFQESGYVLENGVDELLFQVIADQSKTIRGTKEFSNARMARNLFESVIRQQFIRLANLTSRNEEELVKIVPLDIPVSNDYGKSEQYDLQLVYENDVVVGRKPVLNPVDSTESFSLPLMLTTRLRQVSMDSIQQKLTQFSGLDALKTDFLEYAEVVKVMKQRAALGLGNMSLNLNAMFLGNPGTGKTSFARILGDIYRSAGVLSIGHVVEVDRSQLVGGYVGHTARLTYAKCVEALDGILFIDEAYTLLEEGQYKYGEEALNTIMKFMEDHRDRIAVVFAGYPEETKKLYQVNPGMQSRVSREFVFDDYTNSELLSIFVSLTKDKAHYYTLGDGVIEEVSRWIQIESSKTRGTRDFSNARMVRNLFERMGRNQAIRVGRMTSPSQKDFAKFEREDVPN
jgi:AAA+ superfamily predicted ATPase